MADIDRSGKHRKARPNVLDEFGLTEVTLVSITRGGLVAALEAAARPDRIRRVVILEPIAVDRRHIPPLFYLLAIAIHYANVHARNAGLAENFKFGNGKVKPQKGQRAQDLISLMPFVPFVA